MKIAIFSDNFYPELSGISDSIIAFGKGLAARGHEVRFYAPRYSAANFKKVGLPEKELDLGPNISIHRLFSFPFSAATGQGRMVIPMNAAYRSLKEWKPDIIHTQLIFGTGIEALMAARKLKVPLIGTNHTPFREFLRYGPFHKPWIEDKILRYVSWYYNQCAYVTAPSNFLFKEMIEYGFKKPHRAISNPLDVDSFHLPEPGRKEALKKEFGLTDKTVICIGRLAPEKHVDVVMRAVAEAKKTIPGISMLIAGSGIATDNLKQLSRELGLESSVKFAGFVDEKRLPEIYHAAEIYAIASTAETQSLSMMNAMASGVPVIGVNAGALPEYINNQNGFVVEPGDYAAMAQKFIYLFENQTARESLGQTAREYVQQFSAPHIIDEWLELFQTTIDAVHKS